MTGRRLACGCYDTCDHGDYCHCVGCQLVPLAVTPAALPVCSRCQRKIVTFDGSRPTICGNCQPTTAAVEAPAHLRFAFEFQLPEHPTADDLAGIHKMLDDLILGDLCGLAQRGSRIHPERP